MLRNMTVGIALAACACVWWGPGDTLAFIYYDF